MIAVVVLNVAYLVLVSATLTRSDVHLRAMILVGSIGFVCFGVMADIPSMAIWNALIGSLHAAALLRLVRRHRTKTKDPLAEWMRTEILDGLEPALFNRIWELGTPVTYEAQLLSQQGISHDRLALVISGTVDVRVNGVMVNRLGGGAMVGEMSLSPVAVATASTYASSRTVVIEWSKSRLFELGLEEPAIGSCIERAALRSITAKMQLTSLTATNDQPVDAASRQHIRAV